MWIKIAVFLVAAAIVLLLLKIYFDRKNNRNRETLTDELEKLTTAQLKEQCETFQKHKNNLSEDFIKQSTAEQQNTIYRIQKIDEKIEQLHDILAERGEFEFLKK